MILKLAYFQFQTLDNNEMGQSHNVPRREPSEHILPIRVLRDHHWAVRGALHPLLLHGGAPRPAPHHGSRDRHHSRGRRLALLLLQPPSAHHVQESHHQIEGPLLWCFKFFLVCNID